MLRAAADSPPPMDVKRTMSRARNANAETVAVLCMLAENF